jgi:hypothetical protein
MTAYTVELGEPGKAAKFYIGGDLRVQRSAHACKRLTLAEARLACTIFVDSAKREGRTITAKVVPLAD